MQIYKGTEEDFYALMAEMMKGFENGSSTPFNKFILEFEHGYVIYFEYILHITDGVMFKKKLYRDGELVEASKKKW